MNLFTVFILSLFLTIALVPVFKRLAFKMNVVDIPNERKVHMAPMPKMGGVSLAIGAMVPVLLWVPMDDFVRSVLLGSLVIIVFGLIDDIRPLNAKQKIIPQTAAALIVIFLGHVKISCLGIMSGPECILPVWISVPLTLLVILGVTNAINLADGLDGLAGGISMLSFMLIAYLAYQCENIPVAMMAVAMIGGISGFLRYNTHPAVLFLGDAGSQLLGFLSIVFAIALTQANTPYCRLLALPLIGFPILDTLTVMVDRMIKKRSPFSPDKNHFHHRLLKFGFFHTEAVLIIYLIQACYIMLALSGRFHSGWVHIAGFFILSAVILLLSYGARMKQWRFRRGSSFDTVLKKRLRVLKENQIFIRTSFAVLKYGFPLLLIVQILIPRKIPLYFSLTSMGLILLVAVSCYLKRDGFKKAVLRFATYMIIPLLIYFSEGDPLPWIQESWLEFNNIAFMVLVFFIIMTMNLTRRRKGFKISPLDILVFIAVLVFSNMSIIGLKGIHLSETISKVLVLFFSYDVLAGELREETGRLVKLSLCVLAVLALRGLL